MKPTRRIPPPPDADSAAIDAAYGLEPVWEPSAATRGLGEFVAVDCPYCGESYRTPLDLTAGSFSYVEDCQICCQPIDLEARIGEDGALESVVARRLDGP